MGCQTDLECAFDHLAGGAPQAARQATGQDGGRVDRLRALLREPLLECAPSRLEYRKDNGKRGKLGKEGRATSDRHARLGTDE